MAIGKWKPLTPARKLVVELMHHAKKVPSLPLAKTLCVKPLLEARRQADVSWTAVFAKAYAIVAERMPALRTAYIPYPWPHLYEHPESVTAVLIEREYDGQTVLFGARVRLSADTPLSRIENLLRRFRDLPVEQLSFFRQCLRLGKMPGFLRRFVFWHSLYFSGAVRARRFGTFMISSLGNLGVEQFHPLTVQSTYLTYGPIDTDGNVCAKVIYDHRVLDGREVGRALGMLQDVLQGPIVEELRSIVADRTTTMRAA